MKILEMIFLGLTIIVPILFVILALVKIDKVKRSKNFRTTIIKLVFLSFIINGIIYGAIKMNNNSNELEDKQKIDESHKEESNIEKDPSIDMDKEELDNDDVKKENQNEDKQSGIIEKDRETIAKPKEETTTITSSTMTSKGYKIEVIDGVTYVDSYLIANKTYALPESFVPTNTYKNITSTNCAECIDKDAYNAYTKMKSEATGLTLWIASGYRSYSYQDALYSGYVNRSGKQSADTYSARPGHSEHQTGLAFDLNSVSDSFANTNEGKWINENCHKYGFIIRYPKGKDGITGYKYEPWHLRYVGVDLATKLYNNGDWITMEEYFGITSKYAN